MKKLFLKVALASLALICTSCSEDDDRAVSGHNNIEESIVGKWNIKGGTINGGAFEQYSHACETINDYQEFTSAAVLHFVGYSSACEVNDTHVSSYSIDGTSLIVQDENDPTPDVFEIVSLTADDLILKRTVNTPEGLQAQVSYFERR